MSHGITNATGIIVVLPQKDEIPKPHSEAESRAVISNNAQSSNSEDLSLSIICLTYVKKIVFLVMSPEI